MSIYGNKYLLEENNFLFIEASSENIESLMKNWTTSNENHKRQTFESNSLSEEDYHRIADLIYDIRHEEKYSKYKKAFDEICKFCHIVPDHTIITELKINSGSKEGTNKLFVEYTANTKSITLPDDIKLYHMSKVDNIQALNPQFRGKSAKGFLYDQPRVYLTLKKNMPKFLADYKLTEKMHVYEVTQKINSVYVDPLVWGKSAAAVYINSLKPISVKQLK